MGASSSTGRPPSQAQQEEESTAASAGSLPTLRSAFSNLSHSNAVPLPALQNALSLNPTTLSPESSPIADQFARLLPHLGPSIVSQFFSASGDAGATWVDFLRGFNRCCARTAASSSLDHLLKLYSAARRSAGIPCGLEFDADEDKVGGCFTPSDLLMLLWLCWIMARRSSVSIRSKGGGGGGKEGVVLPDVTHLVLSAFVSCGEVGDDEGVWHCDVFGIDKSVSAQKFKMWVLATAPGLAHCFPQYVQECMKACAASANDMCSAILSIGTSSSSKDTHDTHLLTCGRAWSISLTLRNAVGEELLGACFPGTFCETVDNLLYRSSIHGKGLSRFWSNVEGYHGPLLLLISARSVDASESDSSARNWVIGMLTEQGFENRDVFYGNSGSLYAISPIFRMLSPSGKDKNFMYCHLHPAGVYQPKPKPVGLAFGGAIGSERIFIDEDFAEVRIRHHSVDKTYQAGSLIPNQGFLPVEASLVEAEVWGLGGKSARAKQDNYKKRETLFSEQRRKVDLKTFGSWDDSPEKMLMDMVSNPNKVQREDR